MICPEPNELQGLVRELHQEAKPWCPAGLGSRLHWGPPLQCTEVISTSKLNRIVEHSVGDFTVTVQAGTPLLELQAELSATNQWLAVDTPWGSGNAGSVGGLVARGLSGGLQQRYLGVRDQLIGITFLRADGTSAKAGGSVVKNVAGYDLMRLLCGSWGSLGLITAVTLRTYPQLAHRKGLLLQGDLMALELLRKSCLSAPLRPQRLDWLTPPISGNEQAGLLLSLASISKRALAAQLANLHDQAIRAGLHTNVLNRELLQTLEAEAQGAGLLKQDGWLLHLGAPPAATNALLRDPLLQRMHCSIAAGCGQGWAWCIGAEAQSFSISALRERCHLLGGELTVLCQPSGMSDSLPAWGNSQSRSVIEAIKREFDPLQQLNRGRLPGAQA